METFEQANYNVNEHNFTERSDDQLQDRLNELHENNRIIGYRGERQGQVVGEMTLIAFEMAERLRTALNQQIEEAWSEHYV